MLTPKEKREALRKLRRSASMSLEELLAESKWTIINDPDARYVMPDGSLGYGAYLVPKKQEK